jgi:ubiquinone/menaquinone biosynthesis C-methylase UbiE
MPFADNSFDVVMSCVGAMFAPHHRTTADELIRVCRRGGTIGMINWTPAGFIGNLFAPAASTLLGPSLDMFGNHDLAIGPMYVLPNAAPANISPHSCTVAIQAA